MVVDNNLLRFPCILTVYRLGILLESLQGFEHSHTDPSGIWAVYHMAGCANSSLYTPMHTNTSFLGPLIEKLEM